MSDFTVIARYEISAGHEEEVLGLIREVSALSAAEPGSLGYTAYRGLENPAAVAIVETYDSEAGYEAHRATEHFQRLVLGRIIPLLSSRTVQTFPGV